MYIALSVDIREIKREDLIYITIYLHFFRVCVYRNMTSKEVMDEFKACMKSMSKKRLKNIYIDVEPFYNICKYIDWHGVFYSEDRVKVKKIGIIKQRKNIIEVPEFPGSK